MKNGVLFFNCLPYNKFLSLSKLKTLADDKINNLKTETLFEMGRKYYGKRNKCWLSAFSPFLAMFLKGFFFRFVISRDLCGNRLNVHKSRY